MLKVMSSKLRLPTSFVFNLLGSVFLKLVPVLVLDIQNFFVRGVLNLQMLVCNVLNISVALRKLFSSLKSLVLLITQIHSSASLAATV